MIAILAAVLMAGVAFAQEPVKAESNNGATTVGVDVLSKPSKTVEFIKNNWGKLLLGTGAAVTAVPEQTVTLRAVITDVSVQYMPPAYTNSSYAVRFRMVKPDGSLLRMDAMRVTQEQVLAAGDATVPAAMAGLGGKVNDMLAAYLANVSTNANWLAGKPVR